MPSLSSKIISNEKVYPLSDDSILLMEAMKIKPGETVLDMGTGTGILGIRAAQLGGVVTSTDISETVLALADKNAEINKVEINFVKSDLFLNIKKKYDVVMFNPPYLPDENFQNKISSDRQWNGGKFGHETITEFLRELPNYLVDRCYLLFSSLTNKGKETIQYLINSDFSFREIAKKKLFFETLYVYELKIKKG